MISPGAPDWLRPFADGTWPAALRGCVTTRRDASGEDFDLGGAAPTPAAAARRAGLAARLGIERVRFLRQVHGTTVVRVAGGDGGPEPEADGAVTEAVGTALAILTADCLPVLFVDRAGTRVGAAHAGWRGLAAGVLEATVAAMERPAEDILAWLGPAIGPDGYEVGPEVRAAMRTARSTVATRRALDRALRPGRGDRWHLDLAALAATRLEALGLGRVASAGIDSRQDVRRFHSHRRDGEAAGRQAALVWLSPRRRS